MRGSASVALSVCLCLAMAAAPAEPPALWAGLTPGPHRVGFTSALERDASRPLDGAPRPIQVSCWFPAAGDGGRALAFRDYFLLSAGERRPASGQEKQAAISAEKTFFAGVGVDGALVERWLDQPVFALAELPPAPGTWPLVLVAQGNGQSAHHQAVLAEWLASHGFVVCTTPSQARLGNSMTSEADVLPSARAQAADLQFAEQYARAHFRVHVTPPGVVGHSFGGRSALVLAAGGHAAAIVSLDGGLGAAEARGWVDGLSLDRARFAVPILHIYEEGDRAITPDLDLIRSLGRSPRILVKVDAMRHIDFTSLGFGAATVAGLTGDAPPSLADKARAVATLTLKFLDATLNGSAQASTFLQRAPADSWLHVERLRPKGSSEQRPPGSARTSSRGTPSRSGRDGRGPARDDRLTSGTPRVRVAYNRLRRCHL